MIQKGYCILEPNGKALKICSIRNQKKDCIKDFITGTQFSWKELRKIGWNCIKINITR